MSQELTDSARMTVELDKYATISIDREFSIVALSTDTRLETGMKMQADYLQYMRTDDVLAATHTAKVHARALLEDQGITGLLLNQEELTCLHPDTIKGSSNGTDTPRDHPGSPGILSSHGASTSHE